MHGLSVQDERGFNQGFSPVGSTPIRMRRRNDWLLRQIREVGASRILEIGCGTGETAAFLAGNTKADVIATDISPSFIERARTEYRADNLRFETFDLLGDKAPPFGKVDFVCGNGILHHLVKRLPQVLVALLRLTQPGGGLAFIEPNFLNPYCAFVFGTKAGRRFANLEPDEMAFTEGQLRSVILAAGWTDVEVTTRDFLVPGVPVWMVKPITLLERPLEATALTRWLAQSHFVTARA